MLFSFPIIDYIKKKRSPLRISKISLNSDLPIILKIENQTREAIILKKIGVYKSQEGAPWTPESKEMIWIWPHLPGPTTLVEIAPKSSMMVEINSPINLFSNELMVLFELNIGLFKLDPHTKKFLVHI